MFMSPTLPERRARRLAVWTAASALLVAGLAHAASEGQSKQSPINIHSNNADFAQKTGVSTYTGDVRLTRGGLTLTGDKLVVTRLNQGRSHIKAVLTGDPAHIHKQPDANGDAVVTGHARQIEYTNDSSVITLRGHAEVTRDGDEIRGPLITHNVDTGATHAKRGQDSNERVHITIQPARHGNS